MRFRLKHSQILTWRKGDEQNMLVKYPNQQNIERTFNKPSLVLPLYASTETYRVCLFWKPCFSKITYSNKNEDLIKLISNTEGHIFRRNVQRGHHKSASFIPPFHNLLGKKKSGFLPAMQNINHTIYSFYSFSELKVTWLQKGAFCAFQEFTQAFLLHHLLF